MKIEFEDKSYLEVKKSTNSKVLIIIQARDQKNSLKKITNCVEIDQEQLKEILSSL